MSLTDVVRVTITRETSTPTQVGFGTPLIMSYHTVFPELAREYSDVDDMISDGFAAGDPAVLKAMAIFAQSPRPPHVVVGRETVGMAQTNKVTPVATNLKANHDYSIKVNGQTATFTTDTDPTVAEITAGLKSAIDALSEPVAVIDNNTDLDIEAGTPGVPFSLEIPDRTILHQENTTPDGTPTGILEDIVALRDVNDDWYCLHLCNQSRTRIEAVAPYIEGLVRIFVWASADDAILDPAVTDDVLSTLQGAGYVRNMGMFHPLADIEHPDGAWAGKCLPYEPGSITWDLKTLAGITYTDLTSTEKSTIKAKDGNYYARIAGLNVTQIGITPGHEWMDVINGVDWTQVRMQENIFSRLANAKKVPYTDRGIGIIENEVRGVLNQGVANELYTNDPAPVVTVPLAKDVPTADRANRILKNVIFRATLAGAIHEVEVVGTVSV